jgi:tryptophan-rich sensory protein
MRYLASPAQLRASFLRWCLVTVPGVLVLGFLSGRAAGSGPGNPWFDALIKPAAYPPPEAFGIVWSILYVFMGIALALVLAARGAPGRGLAAGVFGLQLVLNLAWSPLFFGAHQVTAALWLLVVLIVVVAVTIGLFWKIRWLAGALLLPYLAWCIFAAYLNYEFKALNPDAESLRESGAAVHIRL